MGLIDLLNGMQNAPRGSAGSPSGSSGGMSPITMAILGLLAYKALKSLSAQPANAGAPSGAPAPAPEEAPGGGLGDLLKNVLGGGAGAGPGAGGGLGDLLEKRAGWRGGADASGRWRRGQSERHPQGRIGWSPCGRRSRLRPEWRPQRSSQATAGSPVTAKPPIPGSATGRTRPSRRTISPTRSVPTRSTR